MSKLLLMTGFIISLGSKCFSTPNKLNQLALSNSRSTFRAMSELVPRATSLRTTETAAATFKSNMVNMTTRAASSGPSTFSRMFSSSPLVASKHDQLRTTILPITTDLKFKDPQETNSITQKIITQQNVLSSKRSAIIENFINAPMTKEARRDIATMLKKELEHLGAPLTTMQFDALTNAKTFAQMAPCLTEKQIKKMQNSLNQLLDNSERIQDALNNMMFELNSLLAKQEIEYNNTLTMVNGPAFVISFTGLTLSLIACGAGCILSVSEHLNSPAAICAGFAIVGGASNAVFFLDWMLCALIDEDED